MVQDQNEWTAAGKMRESTNEKRKAKQRWSQDGHEMAFETDRWWRRKQPGADRKTEHGSQHSVLKRLLKTRNIHGPEEHEEQSPSSGHGRVTVFTERHLTPDLECLNYFWCRWGVLSSAVCLPCVSSCIQKKDTCKDISGVHATGDLQGLDITMDKQDWTCCPSLKKC